MSRRLLFIFLLFFVGCASFVLKETHQTFNYWEKLKKERLARVQSHYKKKRRVASLEESVKELDPNKKTLCTATINSDDERRLFKRYLPDFNHIELADVSEEHSKEDEWMSAACKLDIQCDILVVSGHFGGSFFGDSGYSLSTSKLEELTCNNSCSGILNKPKEVFLFGCNTLAGKEQDHRSPQEYIDVLVADGFSVLEAQQIAAFRYSPVGSSFSDRMARIFAEVPKIYGFTSVGPSGRNASPMLKNYLSKIGDYGDHISSLAKTSVNKTWSDSFSVTTQAQSSGASADEIDKGGMCLLLDKKKPEVSKWLFLEETLKSDENIILQRLPAIATFLKVGLDDYDAWEDEKEDLSLEDKKAIAQIRSRIAKNQKFKNFLVSFLEKDLGGTFLRVKADMLRIGGVLNIFTVSENKKYYSILMGDLSQGVDRARAETICSYDIHFPDLTEDMLPQGEWDVFTSWAVICLKPRDHKLRERIFWAFKDSNDEMKRNAAFYGISEGFESIEILNEIEDGMRKLAQSDSFKEFRQNEDMESEEIEDNIWMFQDVLKGYKGEDYKKYLDFLSAPLIDEVFFDVYMQMPIHILKARFIHKDKLYKEETYLKLMLEEMFPPDLESLKLALKGVHNMYSKVFIENRICSAIPLLKEYEKRIPEQGEGYNGTFSYTSLEEGYGLHESDARHHSSSGGYVERENLLVSKKLEELCN